MDLSKSFSGWVPGIPLGKPHIYYVHVESPRYISHDGSGWCWYINANMTGVYWWDPCYPKKKKHHGSYGYYAILYPLLLDRLPIMIIITCIPHLRWSCEVPVFSRFAIGSRGVHTRCARVNFGQCLRLQLRHPVAVWNLGDPRSLGDLLFREPQPAKKRPKFCQGVTHSWHSSWFEVLVLFSLLIIPWFVIYHPYTYQSPGTPKLF